jgi:hypothetical protein
MWAGKTTHNMGARIMRPHERRKECHARAPVQWDGPDSLVDDARRRGADI